MYTTFLSFYIQNFFLLRTVLWDSSTDLSENFPYFRGSLIEGALTHFNLGPIKP